MRRLSFILILLLLALTLIGFAPVMSEEHYLRIYFSSANVNGNSLSADNPTITVSPGSKITGYLEVIVDNNRGGSWTTPIIGTVSWRRGWFSCISGDAPTGRSAQRFSFDIVAPDTPGTYYIGVFTKWALSCDEVASNDHPAKYGDGNDVWDMPSQGWEEVIRNGAASTGPYRLPGRAIKVIVQLQPTPPTEAPLTNKCEFNLTDNKCEVNIDLSCFRNTGNSLVLVVTPLIIILFGLVFYINKLKERLDDCQQRVELAEGKREIQKQYTALNEKIDELIKLIKEGKYSQSISKKGNYNILPLEEIIHQRTIPEVKEVPRNEKPS